ncbi:MAG: hypothetical protein ABI743_04085 [bacterium]
MRVVLLIIALLTALNLAACNKAGAAGAKGGGVTDSATGLKIISWENAKEYEGQEVLVEGIVTAVKETSGAIFINFHADYRHTFGGFVPGSKIEAVKAGIDDFPNSLQGKKIRIKGMVKHFAEDGQDKPEIEITDPAQIIIL